MNYYFLVTHFTSHQAPLHLSASLKVVGASLKQIQELAFRLHF
jgi:hypothetical protein